MVPAGKQTDEAAWFFNGPCPKNYPGWARGIHAASTCPFRGVREKRMRFAGRTVKRRERGEPMDSRGGSEGFIEDGLAEAGGVGAAR